MNLGADGYTARRKLALFSARRLVTCCRFGQQLAMTGSAVTRQSACKTRSLLQTTVKAERLLLSSEGVDS